MNFVQGVESGLVPEESVNGPSFLLNMAKT